MKKIIAPLLLLLSEISFVRGQVLRQPVIGYFTAAQLCPRHIDLFSALSQPAGLAQLKVASAGIAAERRFMLNELSYYHGLLSLPTSSGTFALQLEHSGSASYGENDISILFGRRLGNRIDAGVSFNYRRFAISGYGNASAMGFDAGVSIHLTEQVHAGVHLRDPVGGKFGKDRSEKVSSLYALGIGYDASEKFCVSLELVKEEDQPLNINTAIDYRVLNLLRVRFGVSTITSSIWFGAGYRWGPVQIDVAAALHPQLGITPGLSALFTLGKNKNESE